MAKKVVAEKSKSKSKNNGNIIKLVVLLIIILIVFCIVRNVNKTSSKEYISLIIDNQDMTECLENDILAQDGVVYISFEDIRKCLDSTIYQEDDMIITSSDKKVATLNLDERDIEINGSTVEINGQAFKTSENIIYIPISELGNVYDIEFSYIEDYKNITIDHYSKKLVKAYATKNISIKSKIGIFSEKVDDVKKGNWVVYVSEEDGWAKVRTQNGFLGYVKSKNLSNFVTQREDMEETEKFAEEEYMEVNIENEDLEKYEQRMELIEQLLIQAVDKQSKFIKISCGDGEKVGLERFKIEAEPVLKECGISIVFE